MAELRKAWGYQGDALNLPVPDVEAAIPFYESVLGFRVVSRGDSPHRSVLLERESVQLGLAENGGDPTQDGCAFEVDDVAALFKEFRANGLGRDEPNIDLEIHDGKTWKVFYAVAPDGLCYWFGEPQ